jgi:hypothetical protein
MTKKYFPKDYIPSVKDAEWFIRTWREVGKFSAPVDAIFKICQQYLDNDNLDEVLIKCAVIDKFSSTNVFDLYKMADHIVRKHIDERLENGDYSLVDEIAKFEIGGKMRNFYSFASKYCHYHKPEKFAIYDSYVAKVLCAFPNDFRKIKEDELREKYETFIDVLNGFNNTFKLNLSFDNLDKYLWCMGRWYLNPYEPTPKYYHREDESPFPKDDIRTKFWEGEKMFVTTLQNSGLWKSEGKEWLKTANDDIKLLASRHTPEQFGLITYIAFQYSKWYPSDDPIWIVEY